MSSSATGLRKWWRIDAAGLALCAFVSAVLYLMAVSPLLEQHAERQEKSAELQVRQDKSDQINSTVADLNGRLTARRRLLEEDRIRLQPADQLNQRLAVLTQLASQCLLSIHEIQPSPVQRTTRHEMVPIQLTGEGNWPACTRFLQHLHDQLPDTDVQSFELTSQFNNDDASARFRFHLLWYTSPRLASAAP